MLNSTCILLFWFTTHNFILRPKSLRSWTDGGLQNARHPLVRSGNATWVCEFMREGSHINNYHFCIKVAERHYSVPSSMCKSMGKSESKCKSILVLIFILVIFLACESWTKSDCTMARLEWILFQGLVNRISMPDELALHHPFYQCASLFFFSNASICSKIENFIIWKAKQNIINFAFAIANTDLNLRLGTGGHVFS